MYHVSLLLPFFSPSNQQPESLQKIEAEKNDETPLADFLQDPTREQTLATVVEEGSDIASTTTFDGMAAGVSSKWAVIRYRRFHAVWCTKNKFPHGLCR